MYTKMPTMAHINAIKKQYTGISFFSGCGGSSTGHKMAGVHILYANEFIEAARVCYKANHLGTIVDGRDIREVTATSILKQIGLKRGELDLLDGSPPCKSFSTSGKTSKGWNTVSLYSDGVSQRTDDLFNEFIRILNGIQPKVFVAENVTGLIKGKAKGYFVEILAKLKSCGYSVSARDLDASHLGVPQTRRRIIFVGVRNDLIQLGFEPVHPKPLANVVTVKQVLPHIVAIRRSGRRVEQYVPSDIPSPTITASDSLTSKTALFSCGGFVETEDGTRRKYTIKELRVISSFPEDFRLTGNFLQRWERIGRAVPPMMMYHISHTIVEKILRPYYEMQK